MMGLGTKIFVEKISTPSGSIYFKKFSDAYSLTFEKPLKRNDRCNQERCIIALTDERRKKKEPATHRKQKTKGYENKIVKHGKGGIQGNSEYSIKYRRTSCRFYR